MCPVQSDQYKFWDKWRCSWQSFPQQTVTLASFLSNDPPSEEFQPAMVTSPYLSQILEQYTTTVTTISPADCHCLTGSSASSLSPAPLTGGATNMAVVSLSCYTAVTLLYLSSLNSFSPKLYRRQNRYGHFTSRLWYLLTEVISGITKSCTSCHSRNDR